MFIVCIVKVIFMNEIVLYFIIFPDLGYSCSVVLVHWPAHGKTMKK